MTTKSAGAQGWYEGDREPLSAEAERQLIRRYMVRLIHNRALAKLKDRCETQGLTKEQLVFSAESEAQVVLLGGIKRCLDYC